MNTTNEKRCPKCSTTKLVSDFYKNRSTKDGWAGLCKSCMREINRIYDQSEKGKAATQRKRKTLAFKERLKKYWRSEKGRAMLKRSRDKDPDRLRAYWAVRRALKAGTLIRSGKCDKCGASGKTEYHHFNGYSWEHRLTVAELCPTCHHSHHEHFSAHT